MTTAIAKPPTIQLYGQSLPPPERSKHRAWIGLRIEALLEHYWTSRPCDAVKAEIMADWMASLEGFTRDELMAACREWAADQTRKPKPADIRALVLRDRAKVVAAMPRPPEPERERVSAEAATEILRAANIRAKNMPGADQ